MCPKLTSRLAVLTGATFGFFCLEVRHDLVPTRIFAQVRKDRI
jgi:hypothetical protein